MSAEERSSRLETPADTDIGLACDLRGLLEEHAGLGSALEHLETALGPQHPATQRASALRAR